MVNNQNEISDERQEGLAIYENWRAEIGGKPSLGAFEVPLYTDAHITGVIKDGYGPYQFLNTVPWPETPEEPPIILRVENYLAYDSAKAMKRTDDTLYHGGWLADEIASLASLCMGIRLKAGGVTRRFSPHGDPRGDPVAHYSFMKPVPFEKGNYDLILPQATGSHSLMKMEPLSTLLTLSPMDVVALIRAARLYQDGVWIAESQPALSWLMFVSAIETAANWRSAKEDPVERMEASRPDVVRILENAGGRSLVREVAEMMADYMGATKKFITFILTFLPKPPEKRPQWNQHSWELPAMKRSMGIIYKYRSKALHAGTPFPTPMCLPSYMHQGWEAPSEIPSGLAASAAGGVWVKEDIPMLLHTFEYIVRHCLLNWWKLMVRESLQRKSNKSENEGQTLETQ